MFLGQARETEQQQCAEPLAVVIQQQPAEQQRRHQPGRAPADVGNDFRIRRLDSKQQCCGQRSHAVEPTSREREHEQHCGRVQEKIRRQEARGLHAVESRIEKVRQACEGPQPVRQTLQ